jgi:hypothetical protein
MTLHEVCVGTAVYVSNYDYRELRDLFAQRHACCLGAVQLLFALAMRWLTITRAVIGAAAIPACL